MKCYLFRRMEIDGKNYYQFFNYDENFIVTSEYADAASRNTKEFFYIEDNGDFNLNEDNLYMLFEEKNNHLDILTDIDIFIDVLEKFQEKYHDFELNVMRLKPIEEVLKIINKRILFQDENILDLLKRIYMNQAILKSNLPLDIKIKQKSNILFHGPIGNGKKTVINLLRENLPIPFAEVSISPQINDTLQSICRQLTCNGETSEEASTGIVVIRDNFDDLSEFVEDEYEPIRYLSNIESITYNGININLKTVTFIVLFDEYKNYTLNMNDVFEILNLMGFDYEVTLDTLSSDQKRQVLMHKYGRIHQYEEFLKSCNRSFKVDRKILDKIIKECSKFDDGMNALNLAIDTIVKKSFLNGVSDVIINEKEVDDLLKSILYYEDVHEEKKEIKPNKKIVIENTLSDLVSKVCEKVVGQDEHVKRILYTIIENRRMASKNDLDEPKQYINNILIRGESGGGKTLICNTIAKLLNIPIFIADATQYTESGYVGADITDMLAELYHASGNNLEEAQKGILVIDEIDKKAGGSGRDDISRGAVQNGLLKIIEGAKIPVNVGNKNFPQIILFDTSRLTIICQGAFEDIEMYQEERIRKSNSSGKVGFGSRKEDIFVEKGLIDKDYVKFGMQHQLMARLPIIINLNKNTVESLRRIMENSSISPLKIEKIKLEECGFEVEYTTDFYDELSKYALMLGDGARGISKALQKVLTSIHVEDLEPEKVEKIIFNGQVVHEPSAIILVPKAKENVKQMVRR